MSMRESIETTEAAEATAGGPAAAVLAAPSPRFRLAWLTGIKELNILLALIVLCTYLSFAADHFFSANNLLSVTRAFTIVAIMAIGQTMVIITGGIDLSVGSILALSGLSTGMLLGSGFYLPFLSGMHLPFFDICILCGGWPLLPAVVAGILVGTVFGLVNGLLITQLGLPPFIATLGTMSIGRGIIYVLTNGYPVTVPRDETLLKEIGQGYIGNIPVPVIILLIVTIICTIFLSQTTIGRYIYAVGGNEEAARLAGINVGRVKLLVYTLSGALSALAGMILLSRLVSAQPSAGLGWELFAIAAAIIGGTSLLGGEGTVLGAVLGAALIGVVENGLVLLGFNTYAYQIVTGAVILLAVGVDIWQKRRQRRI